MRPLFLALSLLVCITGSAQNKPTIVVKVAPAPAPDPPQHPCTAAQIKEYYAVTHIIDTAHGVMIKMVDGMQATGAPYYPKSFWNDMRDSFEKFDLESAFIPAYQKYLSEEDLAQILAFYHSSAGQRMLAAQPLITAAAQDAIRESAGTLGKEIFLRHKDEIDDAKAKYEAGAGASKP